MTTTTFTTTVVSDITSGNAKFKSVSLGESNSLLNFFQSGTISFAWAGGVVAVSQTAKW